ncbi:unnamed protein product, partial [Didymodactylos carnosus]
MSSSACFVEVSFIEVPFTKCRCIHFS